MIDLAKMVEEIATAGQSKVARLEPWMIGFVRSGQTAVLDDAEYRRLRDAWDDGGQQPYPFEAYLQEKIAAAIEDAIDWEDV